MTKWITIAKHEFSYNVRRKEFLFVTFGLPIFMLAIMGIPILLMSVSISHEEYRIGYVDRTGSFEPLNFTGYPDEETARKELLEGKITHFFVIPPDYRSTGKINIFSTNRTLSGTVDDKIRDFMLENLLKGQKIDLVERIKDPMHSEYFILNEKGETGEDGFSALLVSIAFALFFMLSIFTSSNFLLQGVVEEKENRVIEILLSSVSYRELLIGKIFGLGAVGLTQIIVWSMIGAGLLFSNRLVFSILVERMHVSFALLVFALGFFILGFLVFASLMAGVGAVSTTTREGQQMAGIFSIIGAIPLIFSQFILMYPDAILTTALAYFPLTSPITMIMLLSIGEVQFHELMISVLILTFSTLLIIELSVKIFRVSLLMYGKKPTIGEMIKYVRES
ncbi:MAG: ABC transporter permease [Candidatus Methanoperedens sp.]|nr:ABC transporter permease [Candidatus Methanoperedens sp.]MCZ7361148.1 ABC transporter permease [Candidatus Methanoperedens sp.]HLB72315.1 ABC transporter permease [Candidatus Methanoperedens sp.]